MVTTNASELPTLPRNSVTDFLRAHDLAGAMVRWCPRFQCVEVSAVGNDSDGRFASDFPPTQLRTVSDARNWMGY